jgi:hypothetical protein
MLKLTRFGFSLVLVGLSGLVGCDDSSGGSSVGATCRSTCEKSTALSCPNDPATVDLCASQCDSQIAGCSNSSIVQAYLDCVQTAPMDCGDTTGQASSPQCVQQGLAYFACLNGVTADASNRDTSNKDASGSDTSVPSEATMNGTGTLNGSPVTIGCTQSGTHKQFDHLYGGIDKKTVFYCKVTNSELLNLSFLQTHTGALSADNFELRHSGVSVDTDDSTALGLSVSVQVDAWNPDTKTIAGSFTASWARVSDDSTPQTNDYLDQPGSISGSFGGPLSSL